VDFVVTEPVLVERVTPKPTSPNRLNLSLNPYCAPNDPEAPVVVAVAFDVDVVTPELLLVLVVRV
jgi:hypothetical protein